jgi:hypothetical protein
LVYEAFNFWRCCADKSDWMDELTNGIIAFKQAETMSKVQYAVARKMMDNQQMQGAAVLKLIDAATEGINKSGDSLVAAATGLGGEIDTYA